MAIFAKIRKNRQILKALIFKGFERYLRCIFATTSMWLDTSILMSDYRVCHRELVHDFVDLQFLRPRGASVNGNWSTPYFLLYNM